MSTADFGSTPEVTQDHLQRKIDSFRQTPQEKWLWWRVSDDLLVETSPDGDRQMIYYLPVDGCVLVHHPSGYHLDERWEWYVHIGETAYDDRWGCWIFTDLFVDVLVEADGFTHTVLDLEDLGWALSAGLIDCAQASRILADTKRLLDAIRSRQFPPAVVQACPQLAPIMSCPP